ncbi:glutamate receptor ionotropic kainate 4 [Crotalus adamanteus]|uniref:Glutamate receptor ionotropic kainate 4 n=1 Tax=Crotalus adamanteus TaxID=8729 RepID=A0AAW1B036_CROAD
MRDGEMEGGEGEMGGREGDRGSEKERKGKRERKRMEKERGREEEGEREREGEREKKREQEIRKEGGREREREKKIGHWHVTKGLSMDNQIFSTNVSESLFNTTLLVTTILENPYLMLKGNHQELEGNDRYEGFCVDMLKELADILHFNYKIHLVGDGVYGVPETNGTWTGMVGELIARGSVSAKESTSVL